MRPCIGPWRRLVMRQFVHRCSSRLAVLDWRFQCTQFYLIQPSGGGRRLRLPLFTPTTSKFWGGDLRRVYARPCADTCLALRMYCGGRVVQRDGRQVQCRWPMETSLGVDDGSMVGAGLGQVPQPPTQACAGVLLDSSWCSSGAASRGGGAMVALASTPTGDDGTVHADPERPSQAWTDPRARSRLPEAFAGGAMVPVAVTDGEHHAESNAGDELLVRTVF